MTAFLIVNGREVSVERALRHALFADEGTAFVEALIEREIIGQHAEATGVAVSVEELQQAADQMRYERGLTDAGRTLEWVRVHGQTLESMEQAIEHLLLRNKLAAGIPDAEVRTYYLAHREALEHVVLFSIRVESETEALTIKGRLDAGEPFPVVAADASRDPATRRTGGFAGRLRRAEMSADIARAVFDAPTGQPIGPVQTENGYNVFLVAERKIPTIEEEAAGIRLLLFAARLARLRADAVVTFPAIAPAPAGGASLA